MNVNIRGKNVEATEAIKDYLEKKLSRLEKFFETPLHDVHVTLSVGRELHSVEVTIQLPGLLLRAEERREDMYASIDVVVDKLERQIRKHKTKVNRRYRQESGVRSLFKDAVENGGGRRYSDEDEEFQVVRTKQFTLKPMDVDEAILQMNMVGHSFFVFANSNTEQVNVVYIREDGRYGLIEPAI